MALRLDLEGDPDFLADLLDETLTRDSICEKWNASAGFVSDRRRRALAGKSIATFPELESTETPAIGEESTVEEDDKGKRFNFIRHRPVTLEDARDLIRSTGDDPNLYNVAIKNIAYGGDKTSTKISAWPKTGMALVEAVPLAQLYAEAEKITSPATGFTDTERGMVIVLADWQVGKSGRRGATPELLARLADAREALAFEILARRPERILILDAGDGLEGFESGGNPMHTNDLSLPDQLDCYATEMYKFVRLAATHAPVDVGVVCSNHAQWRRGKQTLGRPADDFGIFVHKRVAAVADAADLEATWHYPNEYDESLCVDFMGTPIGLVHGNQFAPGKVVDWWAAQAFGDQAVTRADVLVHGHYHSFFAAVAGQNPATGRERMALGAPTLDSGSDWYRNIKGRDSLPGTLIFDVTPAGFDLGSLKIV